MNTSNVSLLRPNGTQESHPYPTTLDGWQKLVGGYIEVVERQGLILVVNEEGLLRELSPNIQASFLVGQPIVGDAVLLQGEALSRFRRDDEEV